MKRVLMKIESWLELNDSCTEQCPFIYNFMRSTCEKAINLEGPTSCEVSKSNYILLKLVKMPLTFQDVHPVRCQNQLGGVVPVVESH